MTTEVPRTVDLTVDSKSALEAEGTKKLPSEPQTPKSLQTTSDRSISVKDFAYTADNPMHFGIYIDSEDEDDEEDDDDDEEVAVGREMGQLHESEEAILSPTNENTFTFKKDTPLEKGSKAIHHPFAQRETEEDEEGLIHAVALYPFEPENENELRLSTDQIIIISYEYGDGWLVAYDPFSGETGLVPSAYVQMIGRDVEFAEEVLDEKEVSAATPYLPEMLQERNEEEILKAEAKVKESLKESPKESSKNSSREDITSKIEKLEIKE
ncbi:DEKNAAC103475 [Brettanomyces naardenensis]|uniref:DEKNAAC103475 n=1 Tax=Brettanomyces naardenensis TaxID=13370 RepID=A0A448YNN4_BRENA|nr:DEKNAAC103475 [Brettanomyces naardenensis]